MARDRWRPLSIEDVLTKDRMRAYENAHELTSPSTQEDVDDPRNAKRSQDDYRIPYNFQKSTIDRAWLRARNKCELCGKPIDDVHHLLPIGVALALYGNRITEADLTLQTTLRHIANAVCVCHACHVKLHHSQYLPYTDYDAVCEALIIAVTYRQDRLLLEKAPWVVTAAVQHRLF